MKTESSELCGISGKDDEVVRVGEFNRLAAAIRYYHFKPLKEDVKEIKQSLELLREAVDTHVEADARFFAQLQGAKWAIYGIFGCLAVIAPMVYALLRALVIAKVL